MTVVNIYSYLCILHNQNVQTYSMHANYTMRFIPFHLVACQPFASMLPLMPFLSQLSALLLLDVSLGRIFHSVQGQFLTVTV